MNAEQFSDMASRCRREKYLKKNPAKKRRIQEVFSEPAEHLFYEYYRNESSQSHNPKRNIRGHHQSKSHTRRCGGDIFDCNLFVKKLLPAKLGKHGKNDGGNHVQQNPKTQY